MSEFNKSVEDHIKRIQEKYSPENYEIFKKSFHLTLDEKFNEGVDACIELAKNHFTGGGNFYMDLSRQSFINQLEQLKKPQQNI